MSAIGRPTWRWLLALGVALLFVETLHAQNGGIRGSVVDSEDRPLSEVDVRLEFLGGVSREISLQSDDSGDIVRLGIRLGSYRLTLSKEGYETYTEEIRVSPGAPTRIGTLVLQRIAPGPEPGAGEALQSAEGRDSFREGIAFAQAEDYQAALTAFEKVLELEPQSAEAHFNLGVVHGKLGNPDRSAHHFTEAFEVRPDYFEAHVALGDLHAAAGRWAEAMAVLERALEIRADDAVTLFDYGAAAMNVGEVEKARTAFERLVSMEPDHAAGHYQLAMALVNQADNENAARHLERYLELEPEGPQAGTARALLQHLRP